MRMDRCSARKGSGSLRTERDYLQPGLPPARVNAMSSLALAHIGDAVFELLVRLHLAEEGRETSENLHLASVAMVKASAQAEDMRRILPALSGEELAVYHRGRNAHVHSVPKHAKVGDYHEATALEALLGYLYLLGRTERVNTLFSLILEDDHAD